MMFSKFRPLFCTWTRLPLAVAATLALAACAGGPPPAPPLPQTDATGEPIMEADDVAIAGQEAAHSILALPEVSSAAVPPLVRFSGVKSDLATPIDTEPYTELLRDRLLLITRLKLRFVEHTLPPLHARKKSGSSPYDEGNADYEVSATLGADAGPNTYLLRIQFIDLHSGQPLFSGLYRIRPEAGEAPAAGEPGATGEAGNYAPPSATSTPVNLNPPESTAPYTPPPQPSSTGGGSLQ